jgi:hypothetical protein
MAQWNSFFHAQFVSVVEATRVTLRVADILSDAGVVAVVNLLLEKVVISEATADKLKAEVLKLTRGGIICPAKADAPQFARAVAASGVQASNVFTFSSEIMRLLCLRELYGKTGTNLIPLLSPYSFCTVFLHSYDSLC